MARQFYVREIMSNKNDQVIEKLILKMTKEDSSFFYFTMEAHEGICFYSTLPHQEGDKDRLIECLVPTELEPEFKATLSSLQKEITIEVLKRESFKDSL